MKIVILAILAASLCACSKDPGEATHTPGTASFLHSGGDVVVVAQ